VNRARAALLPILLVLLLLSTGCTCRMVGDRVETDCYGDLVPCVDDTYSLGTPLTIWNTLYVENIVWGNPPAGTGNVTTMLGGTAGSIPYFTFGTNIEDSGASWDNVNREFGIDGDLCVSGNLSCDLHTDRWLFNNSNTFLGIGVAGADTLAHTGVREGWENTAIGSDAGHNLTTGYSNTLIGNNAGDSITDGYSNTFVGADAGQSLTTDDRNVAVGDQAMMNATGNSNVAVGGGAMGSSTDDYNVAIGLFAMNNNAGDYNTAVGYRAGFDNAGCDNVFLGHDAGSNNIGDDKLYIDNTNTATPLIYGDFATNTVTINDDLDVAGTTIFNDQIILTGSGLAYMQRTMPIQIARIIAVGTPTRIERGIFQGFSLPVGGANEELFSCECVPGNWDVGSDMYLYVDGWIDTANTGKNFQLRVAHEHWTTGDVVPITSTDVDVETATGAAAQFTSYKVKFTIATGTIARGDALGIKLTRIAASAAEIAGEFVVEGMVLVYRTDSIGSATE